MTSSQASEKSFWTTGILKQSLKNIFTGKPIIGLRRNQHKQKIKSCSLRNCLICPKLSTKNFIQSKTNGMKFPIINHSKLLTCNTAGIVYCIECTRCGKQYVGQTQRKLKSRLSEHFDPRHNPDQALKKHYPRNPKHTLGNMRFRTPNI